METDVQSYSKKAEGTYPEPEFTAYVCHVHFHSSLLPTPLGSLIPWSLLEVEHRRICEGAPEPQALCSVVGPE